MRCALNHHTIANDVRMRRSMFSGSFLLVEGPDDQRLFRCFVDVAQCQIIIGFGKENVWNAIVELNSSNLRGAVGVVDSDFDGIEASPALPPNLFSTDWHDAECMMLRGSALDRLLLEFATPEKLLDFQQRYRSNIQDHLLAQAQRIGLLLWHSIRANLSLSFDNLEPREFVDPETLNVDCVRLIQHVKNKSSKHDLQDADIRQGIQRLEQRQVDPWRITRGHDYANLLGYALRHRVGSSRALDVTRERLEQSLRLAFPASEFRATRLCDNILSWESSNSPYVILTRLET
jgi:hypothetical protein